MKISITQKIIFGIVLASISYFPIFFHLDSQSIAMWDEALYALRALHLEQTGEYLDNFNKFEGLANHRNTKPELISYLQVLSFKVFGHTELALRLPIALIALLTLITIFNFSKREFNNYGVGIFSCLVLLTSHGYFGDHVARTGEHDTALALFSFLMVINFYNYLKYPEQKIKYLIYFLLSLLACTFTKTVAGLFFAPAITIYAIFSLKTNRNIFKDPYLYITLACYILCVTTYFALKEVKFPGFMTRLWEHEGGGRYFETVHGHSAGFFYYMLNFATTRFTPWIFFIPISFLFIRQNKKLNYFLLLNTICIVSYTIILSSSKSKGQHYDAPLYPFLAIQVGFVLYFISKSLEERFNKILIVRILLIVSLFTSSYLSLVKNLSHKKRHWNEELYGDLIKSIPKNIKEYTVHLYSFNPHAVYYVAITNLKEGYNIKTNSAANFEKGELVATCNINRLSELYEYQILHNAHTGGKLIEILAYKK